MMGARTEPGWYYVGDGQLRYHDEFGWTDYLMDTHDTTAMEWPPPEPKTLLQQLREQEAARSAAGVDRGPRMLTLFRRYRARH